MNYIVLLYSHKKIYCKIQGFRTWTRIRIRRDPHYFELLDPDPDPDPGGQK